MAKCFWEFTLYVSLFRLLLWNLSTLIVDIYEAKLGFEDGCRSGKCLENSFRVVTAMLLEGLLFLPIIGSSLKAQIETFAAYIFTTSIVILAVVGITSLFKRKL